MKSGARGVDLLRQGVRKRRLRQQREFQGVGRPRAGSLGCRRKQPSKEGKGKKVEAEKQEVRGKFAGRRGKIRGKAGDTNHDELGVTYVLQKIH